MLLCHANLFVQAGDMPCLQVHGHQFLHEPEIFLLVMSKKSSSTMLLHKMLADLDERCSGPYECFFGFHNLTLYRAYMKMVFNANLYQHPSLQNAFLIFYEIQFLPI